MEDNVLTELAQNLLVVLAAGLVTGLLCKRVGISLLVGYLLVGAAIGDGGLHWVSQENRELEFFARGGALLLLFSIGLEFSLQEFVRLSRFFLIGGSLQMLLVGLPAIAILLFVRDWRPAVMIAMATTLSSTVLVFKSLAENGQSDSMHGRRAVGILLFQDVALVPLILVIPLLTGTGADVTAYSIAKLFMNSVIFVVSVPLLSQLLQASLIPLLVKFRSRELVLLFALSTLGGVIVGSLYLGLPPAIGALGAGLVLSGNRISAQIDALVLPYRETFAAIFFVSLGTLLHPVVFLTEPLLLMAGILIVLVLKAGAATAALKVIGSSWRSALGMGLGLAQLGEFSFVLFSECLNYNLITANDYNRLLFVAMATLLVTPQLIRFGLRLAEEDSGGEPELEHGAHDLPADVERAIVVGAGPVGSRLARKLDENGGLVSLIDLSPVNLHQFAQEHFHTVAGDATDSKVLALAHAASCQLALVCVPSDDMAEAVTETLRKINLEATIIVRCRYESSVAIMERAGATIAVSEEESASVALLELVENMRPIKVSQRNQ